MSTVPMNQEELLLGSVKQNENEQMLAPKALINVSVPRRILSCLWKLKQNVFKTSFISLSKAKECYLSRIPFIF